ncbi:MAG: hypothetical protein AB7O97_23930 [Planctomycetota bacterium]
MEPLPDPCLLAHGRGRLAGWFGPDHRPLLRVERPARWRRIWLPVALMIAILLVGGACMVFGVFGPWMPTGKLGGVVLAGVATFVGLPLALVLQGPMAIRLLDAADREVWRLEQRPRPWFWEIARDVVDAAGRRIGHIEQAWGRWRVFDADGALRMQATDVDMRWAGLRRALGWSTARTRPVVFTDDAGREVATVEWRGGDAVLAIGAVPARERVLPLAAVTLLDCEHRDWT